MIKHICNKMCIKMTTLDKTYFNIYGYNTLWDTTRDIKIYWKYLDDLTKKLDIRDITTIDCGKVSVSFAQMWQYEYFTEESLIK